MGTSFTIFSVELQWSGNRAAFSLKEFPCTGWYLPLSLCEEKDILCTTKYLVSTQRQIGPEFELLPQQEKILPSQTYRYKGDTVPCTLGKCVPLILPALPGWWYTSGFCCQWAAGQVEKKHAQFILNSSSWILPLSSAHLGYKSSSWLQTRCLESQMKIPVLKVKGNILEIQVVSRWSSAPFSLFTSFRLFTRFLFLGVLNFFLNRELEYWLGQSLRHSSA